MTKVEGYSYLNNPSLTIVASQEKSKQPLVVDVIVCDGESYDYILNYQLEPNTDISTAEAVFHSETLEGFYAFDQVDKDFVEIYQKEYLYFKSPELKNVARQMIQLGENLAPYDFKDTVDDVEAEIEEITTTLSTDFAKGVLEYINYLREFDEESLAEVQTELEEIKSFFNQEFDDRNVFVDDMFQLIHDQFELESQEERDLLFTISESLTEIHNHQQHDWFTTLFRSIDHFEQLKNSENYDQLVQNANDLNTLVNWRNNSFETHASLVEILNEAKSRDPLIEEVGYTTVGDYGTDIQLSYDFNKQAMLVEIGDLETFEIKGSLNDVLQSTYAFSFSALSGWQEAYKPHIEAQVGDLAMMDESEAKSVLQRHPYLVELYENELSRDLKDFAINTLKDQYSFYRMDGDALFQGLSPEELKEVEAKLESLDLDSVKFKSKTERQFVQNVIRSFKERGKEWEDGLGIMQLPRNGKTKRVYQGMNVANLWLEQHNHTYHSHEWFTFKQAQELGYRVKKGSKAAYIDFFRFYDTKTKKDFDFKALEKLSAQEKVEKKKDLRIILLSRAVFNGDQLEGYALDEETKIDVDSVGLAKRYCQNLIDAMDVEVTHAEVQFPQYRPGQDLVAMPVLSRWKEGSEELYYGALIHELAHATGHPTRMNRLLSTSFGSQEYAKEELIVETAATFQMLRLGLPQTQDNALAYLHSWARIIGYDPLVFIDSVREAMNVREWMEKNGEMENLLLLAQEGRLDEEGYVAPTLPEKTMDYDVQEARLMGQLAHEVDFKDQHIIAYDVETTGVNPSEDEILSMSIVDSNQTVLYHSLFKPETKTSWEKAMSIHGITPEMVQDAPYFKDELNKIQSILNQAGGVVGFNILRFDNKFLQANGVELNPDNHFDIMNEYAKVHGEWQPRFKKYKWPRLIDVVNHYGYDDEFGSKAHSSIEDAKATMFSYKKLKPESDSLKAIKEALKELDILKDKKFELGRMNDLTIHEDGVGRVYLNLEDLTLKRSLKSDAQKYRETLTFDSLDQIQTSIKDIVSIKAADVSLKEALPQLLNDVQISTFETHRVRKEVDLNILKEVVPITEYAERQLGLTVVNLRNLDSLREHDSVRIYPDNTFTRFSKEKVGGSIVDFILEFDSRVTGSTESERIASSISLLSEFYSNHNDDLKDYTPKVNQTKRFELPKKSPTNDRGIKYFVKTRGIDEKVVNEWYEKGKWYQTIYEGLDGVSRIPNIVFVGEFGQGNPKFASVRGLGRSNYKSDVSGSMKATGIHMDHGSNHLVITESPIDAMSYQSLYPEQNVNFLSVNGVAGANTVVDTHLKFRKTEQKENKITIAFDNDQSGIDAAKKLEEFLTENYSELALDVQLPSLGKDFNEELTIKNSLTKKRLQESESQVRTNSKEQGFERQLDRDS